MRDIDRIDSFMNKLGEVWKEHPDLRFTQLIVNVMQAKGSDMYYYEEDSFLKAVKEYYNFEM